MTDKITNKVLRYIVPFNYSVPFGEAIRIIDNKENGRVAFERDVIDRAEGVESDIYDYIRNEFRYETTENIKKLGCSFRAIIENNKPILSLVSQKRLFSDEAITGADFMTIKDIGLLLGRNGLGFLWYEIEDAKGQDALDSVKELVEHQNIFKEFCRYEEEVAYWKRIVVTDNNKDSIRVPSIFIKEEKIHKEKIVQTSYYTPFYMGIWIAELLDFLNVKFIPERKNPQKVFYKKVKKCVDALENGISKNGFSYSIYSEIPDESNVEFIPDKPLLFTYCCLPVSDDGILEKDDIKTLIYLSNGYKSSYSLSENEGKDLCLPFSNVAWHASHEGCACIAKPLKESQIFLNDGFPEKIRVDYFVLYLKVLFQSYSLLKYATRIQEELSAIKDDYLGGGESNTIEDLIGSVNLFLTKSMATSVSHINHQNDFYIYLKRKIHIHEDVKSVTSGLESLAEIQKENIQEIEAKKSDRIQAVMGLFSLLAIGSALIDTYDLLGKFIPQWDLASVLYQHPVYAVIYAVVFSFMIIISIIAATFAFKALRDTKRSKGKKEKKNDNNIIG